MRGFKVVRVFGGDGLWVRVRVICCRDGGAFVGHGTRRFPSFCSICVQIAVVLLILQ